MSISILGAGSWGSALAITMSNADQVFLWSNLQEQVDYINKTRTNPGYLLESVKFSDNITATSDFSQIINSELFIVATPLCVLREMSRKIKQYRKDNLPDIVWACKGFEAESGLLPHQIINEVLGEVENVGALLGPTFAKEVAQSLPTAIVLSSESIAFAQKWITKLQNIPNFRIYANSDVIGSELGAGVKNVMAIATGIADGLNFGLNARAALITRGLSEISRLVVKCGGKPETASGLTGVGDLILTCTGELSRNRTVGLELAKGRKIDTILSELGHVAEGVTAAKETYKHSKRLHLEMPIVETVYRIIYEDANITDSVEGLLKREPKLE